MRARDARALKPAERPAWVAPTRAEARPVPKPPAAKKTSTSYVTPLPHDHTWQVLRIVEHFGQSFPVEWHCTVEHCDARKRLTRRQFLESKRQARQDARYAARVTRLATEGRTAKQRREASEALA